MRYSVRESLDGLIFGRWTVLSDTEDKVAVRKGKTYRYRVVVAKCECGTVRSVLVQHLKGGKSVSCGCYQKEQMSTLAARSWAKRTVPSGR